MGIWVLLVIAALVAFVLIALHLYKKVRTTLAQAQDVMELVGQFGEAMDAAEYEAAKFAPHLHADIDQKNRWRHQRRVNRVRRAQRKQARRDQTLSRWRKVPAEVTKR